MSRSEQIAVYQFKVVLRGISPMIWRRLLMRSDHTVADLHYAIKIAMGWSDSHLNPGLANFDLMLAKTWQISERWRVQFRSEAFNAFNTPAFNQPAQVLGAANFGVVTGATSRRILQFGVKLQR